jgi:hypothetical protein
MAASLSVQRGMWNNLNANGIPPFTQINLTIELGYTVGARVETKLLGAGALNVSLPITLRSHHALDGSAPEKPRRPRPPMMPVPRKAMW